MADARPFSILKLWLGDLKVSPFSGAKKYFVIKRVQYIEVHKARSSNLDRQPTVFDRMTHA